MMVRSESNSRLRDILAQVNRFSRGDYTQQLSVTETMDDIDALSAGLNQLGDVLRHGADTQARREERIQRLLEAIPRYTLLDFSERAPIYGEGDEIDALAAGLNAMGEEVIDHINRLKDSEAQIQSIFKNAPDAVLVIDRHDRIMQWNPAASRIFGWAQEEVAGQQLHSVLVPPPYRERHLAGMQQFLKTGQGRIINRTVELPALCKDGTEIPIELTISPARLKDDYLFIAFLRDIRARKRNEEKILQLNAALEQRVLERTEQFNASERKYRQLFENNPMPLWVLDINTLQFMDVNESALTHYGYTREEFLSMTAPQLRPPEELERYMKLNHGAKGTRNVGIWKHIRKDGSIIHCEIIVHEMVFEGRAARLVLSNDVTEKLLARRELELSEARFRRIFDSKMTGFFFWDEDGTITDANDLFLEMVGYSRDEVRLGRLNLRAITPREYRESEVRALEQIRATGVCDPFEKEYIHRNGTRVPVLIGAANIDENNAAIRGVTCVMDISQRKKMEEEIVELNRDLELRISERTKALKIANRELESFTYSVSHDLRAPLRAIHGYSQMLSEDYETKLDPEGVRLLKAVKFNARRMGQLVDDLLAFSRLGKRVISESEVDVTALVNEVLDDFTSQEKMRATITVHSLGTAQADGTLLRQAFLNLLSNALKYSSRKDRPEVEVGLKDDGGEKTYYIRDNGAGFDMAYYQKLFGVFQRLHGQEEFEGTGVGLAIVQRIVHRHGGKIWAEGKVGEGAVFYFTLGRAEKVAFRDDNEQDDADARTA